MTDERFFELCKYERQLAAEGYSLIAGIDEAGRGPLAGPVAAACVIFKSEGPFVKGADDSKKLSEKRRESLFEEIKEKSFAYGISLVDNHRIDEINILQATYEAMRNALEEAIKMADDKMPGILLVDHVHIPQVEIPQISITHGDAQSVSIASASILAKVSRDRLMKQFDEEFPRYGFAKHKGYGTKAHYEAIAQYGPSEIHRMTFLKKLYS
ncbi:MAG: ribonuclease HII [Clostridia bacterium]|nr:ribonuclease HII [Clostridia bacterium]